MQEKPFLLLKDEREVMYFSNKYTSVDVQPPHTVGQERIYKRKHESKEKERKHAPLIAFLVESLFSLINSHFDDPYV